MLWVGGGLERPVPSRAAGGPLRADGRFIDVPAGRFPARVWGFDARASQTWPNHGDRYDAPNRDGSAGRAPTSSGREGIVFYRFDNEGFSSNRD
jgi:hypothetical protein